MDHIVLPANYTMPAFETVPRVRARSTTSVRTLLKWRMRNARDRDILQQAVLVRLHIGLDG